MARRNKDQAVALHDPDAQDGRLDDGISYAVRSAVHRRLKGQAVEISDAIVAEARTILARPAGWFFDVDRVAVWLAGVASGVNDAPPPEAIVARAQAVILACQEIAADDPNDAQPIGPWCFSDESLIVALRTFERWPSVATLYRFLAERAEVWSRFCRELERIVYEADTEALQDPARRKIEQEREAADDQQRTEIARRAAQMAPRLGNSHRDPAGRQRRD